MSESDTGKPVDDDYYEELGASDMQPPHQATGEEDGAMFLDWRLDPHVSHSDWTIRIITKNKNKDATVVEYHVHRNVLTYGLRSSGYFQRVCRIESDFRESSTRTSQIELEQVLAEAFPTMLDFIYQDVSKRQVSLTSTSATVLHCLAQYFDIGALRYETMAFIKNSLHVNNCGTYYKQAYTLRNKVVLGVLVDFCATMICGIFPRVHTIVEYAEPQFWAHINELSLATFRELTNEALLPVIESTAALDLLSAEASLVKNPEHSKLSSLQERCIKPLSCNYKLMLDDKRAATILQKQGSLFLSSLLIESLRVSSNDIVAKDAEFKSKRERYDLQ
ncbi:hypothetical protein MPSEU_000759100 [Mayamaea pseudoterrestris]|nr:hypothetical protein MPSEU_000759100 [Mayamaea pseudoterrestris]